jgi:hypothetical protein
LHNHPFSNEPFDCLSVATPITMRYLTSPAKEAAIAAVDLLHGDHFEDEGVPRHQQVTEADPTKQLGAHTI